MTEPARSAAEAAELLGSQSVSSTELTGSYLDRIERLNPILHAVIAIAPDALDAARASDQRRRNGDLLGPLDGIPVLIKDNIEAAGLPGTAGSRALLSAPPAADAPLVAQLRGAGMVVLGATNLSEWANFRSLTSTSGWSAVGGQTRNPHDTGRNTSGSSSGSAAAVAAGLVPVSVGTETDGSIVSPAGVCGVVGFKPTRGSIPAAGIVPISPRQDTAGPMARTVTDAVALYRILAGVTAPLPAVELAGRRVASWRQPTAPPEVAACHAELERLLAAAGAIVVPTAAEEPSGPFEDAELQALVAEFSVALPAYLATRPGEHPRTWAELLAFNQADEVELSKFSDEIFGLCAEAIEAGGTTNPKYLQARQACDAAAAQSLTGVLADCAFTITPTNSPAWPIRYGEDEHNQVLTSSLCAITGSPSISLPAGSVGGLPLGISLLGRRGADLELLGYAAAVERLLPPPAFPTL
ncbi:MAG: amidase family protein [Jatrophihabitantaceae bacterium]